MNSRTSLWKQLQGCSSVARSPRFPSDSVVLFPPRDDAAAALQLLLAAAATSVRVEMFAYTDARLDQALHAKAQDPTIALFQLTLDSSQIAEDVTMAGLVAGWKSDLGVRVVTGRSEHGRIIHRKVAVVDGYYVVSGSTNWTNSGERLEDNELVIRRGAPLASWYAQVLDANFARVKAAMLPAAAA